MPSVTLFLMGELTHDNVSAVFNAVGQARQGNASTKGSEFRLIINSIGGPIHNGIALYNILRASGLKVITHNIAEVSSAANLVFLAGDERNCSAKSNFGHHGSFYSMSGNVHRVMYEDARYPRCRLVSGS